MEIPRGVLMMLKSFGFDPEATFTLVAGIHQAATDQVELSRDIQQKVSGLLDITIRNEHRLDAIIAHLGITMDETHGRPEQYIALPRSNGAGNDGGDRE